MNALEKNIESARTHLQRFQAQPPGQFVNGAAVPGDGASAFENRSPVDGSVLHRVAAGAACIWTGDSGRALRLAHGVEAGMVPANSENNRHLPLPYGGMQASGIGRAGDCSFDLYMETKSVCIAMGTHTVPRLGV